MSCYKQVEILCVPTWDVKLNCLARHLLFKELNMYVCKQGIDHLNDAISYIIDSELDSETKLQMIKNLVNLISRERKFMDYDGLKCLKDHVDKRVRELKGK